MNKVFVYGSLKLGFHNHSLLDGIPFKKAVALGIDLYRGTHFPFAKRGDGFAIGELYEVDELTFHRLDMLEGHPNFYMREMVQVKLEDGSFDYAWIYLCVKGCKEGKKIVSGEWELERLP